jgi:hypothetical protein
MRRAPTTLGALAVSLWLMAVCATVAAQTTRSVYISVFDDTGQQIRGVAPEDLTLKEDGDEYPVTSVTYPVARLHLTVMVEQNLAAVSDVREGIFTLAERLIPHADIGLVIVGHRAETVVEHTSDINTIVESLNGLITRWSRSAGNVVDAVHEVSRQVEEAAPERPAIVAVAVEMLRLSGGMEPSRALDQLRRSRAVFHTVTVEDGPAVTTTGASQLGIDFVRLGEMEARNKLLSDGPRQSGGHHVVLRNTNGAVDALDEIGDELSAQYRVTWELPAGVDPDDRLEVSIGRRDARLRAPTRIAD